MVPTCHFFCMLQLVVELQCVGCTEKTQQLSFCTEGPHLSTFGRSLVLVAFLLFLMRGRVVIRWRVGILSLTVGRLPSSRQLFLFSSFFFTRLPPLSAANLLSVDVGSMFRKLVVLVLALSSSGRCLGVSCGPEWLGRS